MTHPSPQPDQPDATALTTRRALITLLWHRIFQSLHSTEPRHMASTHNALHNLLSDQSPVFEEAFDSVMRMYRTIPPEKLNRLLTLLEHRAQADSSSSIHLFLPTHANLVNLLLTIIHTEQPRDLLWEAYLLLGYLKDPRAVPTLIASLQDKRPRVRLAAAYALGNIGDPRATEPLLTLLHEERDDLRWITVSALGKLKDPRAWQPLLNTLSDPCQTVRDYAISALKEIKISTAPNTSNLLRIFLKALQEPTLATLLTPVLRVISDEQAIQQLLPSLVEVLIAHLHHNNDIVRIHAIQLLGQIGNPRAVTPLLTLLNEQNPALLINCIEALDRLNMLHAITPQAINSLLEYLPIYHKHSGGYWPDHPRLIHLLGQINDQRVIPSLLAFLAEPHHPTQAAAISVLKQLGTRLDILPTIKKQVVDTLITVQLTNLRSYDEDDRQTAIDILSQLGSDHSLDPLKEHISSLSDLFEGDNFIIESRFIDLDALIASLGKLLESDSSTAHFAAIQILGNIRDDRAVQPLTDNFPYLATAKQVEIIIALDQIGVLNTPKQPAVAALVEPLIERLTTSDPTDLTQIIQMLGQIGDRRAIPSLIALFPSQDSATQAQILTALERLRMLRPTKKQQLASLVEPLLTYLHSPDPSDRLRTIQMLGKLGDPRATDPLLAIFPDQDLTIQAHITIALDQLNIPLNQLPPTIKDQAVTALLAQITPDSDIDRHLLVQLLGKLADPRAIPLLLTLLAEAPTTPDDDDDDNRQTLSIQREIISTLQHIDIPPEKQKQVMVSVVEQLITRLSTTKSKNDRIDSVRLLGQIGDERAISPLLTFLGDPLSDRETETTIVIPALEQLGTRLGILQSVKQYMVDALIAQLRSGDHVSPFHLLEILETLNDQRIVDPLLSIFPQQPSHIQVEIINILQKLDIPPTLKQSALASLVEGLIAALHHNEWPIRQDAALMLGRVKDQSAVAPLLARLSEEDFPNVQVNIVEALMKIDTSAALEGIPYLLNSQYPYPRVRGVWNLADLQGQDAIPHLTTLLDDPVVGEVATFALQAIEHRFSAQSTPSTASPSTEETPIEELSLEERKQREFQRGRVMALDPDAQSIDENLPAFMAPPPDAPAYYGFVVLDDVEVEGFRLGKISDFDAMPDMARGDAFVVAPDNSRAGLVWELSTEVFITELCRMTERRWGVWTVGFLYPMTTRENMRRNLRNILPYLRKEWHIWQEYYL